MGEGCGVQYEPGDTVGCANAALQVLQHGHQNWQSGLTERAAEIYTVDQHFEELFKRYEAMV